MKICFVLCRLLGFWLNHRTSIYQYHCMLGRKTNIQKWCTVIICQLEMNHIFDKLKVNSFPPLNKIFWFYICNNISYDWLINILRFIESLLLHNKRGYINILNISMLGTLTVCPHLLKIMSSHAVLTRTRIDDLICPDLYQILLQVVGPLTPSKPVRG